MAFDIFPFTLTLLMKSTLQIILTLAELFKRFPVFFFQMPLSSSYLIMLVVRNNRNVQNNLRKGFPDSYRSSGLPPFPPDF